MEFFVARPGLPVCVVRFSFVSKKRLSIPQTIVHYGGDIRQPEKMGGLRKIEIAAIGFMRRSRWFPGSIETGSSVSECCSVKSTRYVFCSMLRSGNFRTLSLIDAAIIDVFSAYRHLVDPFGPRGFYPDAAYFRLIGSSITEAGASARAAIWPGKSPVPAAAGLPACSLAMRGRLARSSDRASVAPSGRARLLRAG
ncbi:hypothetical protein, partial [Burkholderia vietnamiensis]|uniref:hypothetical protein n=1 Tax=Burkholderia vietnamiensis TaxID=60552 RepID=UPI002DD4306B